MRPPLGVSVPPHGGFYPDLRTIDQVGSATPGAGAESTLLAYQVPPRQRGVIWGFGQSVLDVDAWGVITWRITVDGSTAENCLWTTRVGLMAFPARIYVPVGPRQTVRVLALNGGVAGFAVCARIRGNFWALEDESLGKTEQALAAGAGGS